MSTQRHPGNPLEPSLTIAPHASGSDDRGAEGDLIGPIQLLDVASGDPIPTNAAAVVPTGAGPASVALTAGAVHEAAAARAKAAGERLIARIRHGLRPGSDPEVQKEAAALIALITDLVSQEFNEFFSEISIAVTALTSDPPNLVLATRIRKHVRMRTNLLLRPLLFLRSGHPAVQVILGLGTNLYLALPIAVFLLPLWLKGGASGIPDQIQYMLIWVGVAGALGSIVSILVRIQDFDDQQAEHRSILFFTGFFKPVVGITSALFVVSMFEAGIITLGLAEGIQENFFYVSLAFVAGFSERLAGDIVARTEKQLGDPGAAAGKGAATAGTAGR